jgi:trehalose synthase
MSGRLEDYAPIVGAEVIHQLRLLARPMAGARVVHLNSTREGGGVAEILRTLVPLQRELGLDARWEVIEGRPPYYQCTKHFHNGLQGHATVVPPPLLQEYETTNRRCADELASVLEDADYVFIHDPQPAAIASFLPRRRGKWIWRCHIDASRPYRPVWKYLRGFVARHDASVFSLADFAQALPHPVYLVPPSIDPLGEKNIDLPPEEVAAVHGQFGIDSTRPLMLQVSRFDRFKDPLGVMRAHHLARAFCPGLQLVLAGSGATDDPEGEAVLAEVRGAARDDPDVHVLLLPPDAHRTINALQRAADFVLQKSLREGFGLTVAEALWKGKAVIGGDTGGIRLQVIDHHTGFLVSTPEGAALRIRYLLHHPETLRGMGRKAREFVRENFLITRQLREYLTLMLLLTHDAGERLQLG